MFVFLETFPEVLQKRYQSVVWYEIVHFNFVFCKYLFHLQCQNSL